MRIGVFGGTFDPVHLGHLILAELCREQAELDQVLFIPAARPPHKLQRPRTSFHHRAEMLELAIAGHASFRVERMEEERPGPSYTVHTLESLRQRDPASELFLIVGSDTLADLPSWYEPRRILELARLLVVARPGAPLVKEAEVQTRLGLSAAPPLSVVNIPLLEISSSDLRRRVAGGQSIRFQTSRAVEIYIREKELYRGESALE